MANSKTLKVYYESVDASIQRVFDLNEAEVIIKEDGSVTSATQKYTEESIVPSGNIELDISNLLVGFGMPTHVMGYRYTREAIKIILSGTDVVHAVTTKLYPEVANIFDTKTQRVERGIRQAIEMAWGRGNVKLQDKIFRQKYDFNRIKPTNSEFLFTVVEQIRILNQKNN